MARYRIMPVWLVTGVLLAIPWSVEAQRTPDGSLETATRIKCSFSLITVGNWGDEEPEAEVKPANLVLEFEAVNADEGTAQLASSFGVYDIIVRYGLVYDIEKSVQWNLLKGVFDIVGYPDPLVPGNGQLLQ